MIVPTLQQAMAADLAGTFTYEFKAVAVVEGTEYQVLTNDPIFSENVAYGGEELIDLLEIHFQASQLPSLPNETALTVFSLDGKKSKTKISISSKLSADENELIVTVRAA